MEVANGVSLEDVKKQLGLMGYTDVPDDVVLEFLDEIKAEEPEPPPEGPPPAAAAGTPPRGNTEGRHMHDTTLDDRSPPLRREELFATPPHTPVRGWSASNSPAGSPDIRTSSLHNSPWGGNSLSAAPSDDDGFHSTKESDGFHSSKEGAPGTPDNLWKPRSRGGRLDMSPPIDVEPSPPPGPHQKKTTQKRSSALLGRPAQRVPVDATPAEATSAASRRSAATKPLPASAQKSRPRTSRGRRGSSSLSIAGEEAATDPPRTPNRSARMSERAWRTPTPAKQSQLQAAGVGSSSKSTPGKAAAVVADSSKSTPPSPASTGVIFCPAHTGVVQRQPTPTNANQRNQRQPTPS